MKKIKIWGFFHYSIILEKWYLEMVTGIEDEKIAEAKSLENIMKKYNYNFNSLGTIRCVKAESIEVDVNQFVIGGFAETPKEEVVGEQVIKDNLNKFVFDLDFIKDKFTENETEKKLVEKIKKRVLKETVEQKTGDKSEVISK